MPDINQVPLRAQSLPGMNIPAGYSQTLGNRLGLAAYANLNSKYSGRFDVPPPCKAPRQRAPDHAMRVEQRWDGSKERLKPETLPPAGGLVQRVRGKRMVDDNTNYLSNADTLIWGRDVDGSEGVRSMGNTRTYQGSAGLNPKVDREPAWGVEPPTCHRTFGENPHDDNWHQVQYERHDPRRESEFAQRT